MQRFLPARYSGSEAGAEAVRCGRETIWSEAGRTAVVALGQKTWTTSRGDFGVFDWLLGDFGARADADGNPTNAADASKVENANDPA
ncbi:type VI secretion system accessory protein TagJ [Caballeronia insecticola]|uniref:type VI secretion system accessory protein TagJ n=1 Tax=Caballeronia insecticola TaxID=758793 RepID=UPI001182CE3E|nr:type VI secretion system accessory protein TagJ [Caballeronia insecticola]